MAGDRRPAIIGLPGQPAYAYATQVFNLSAPAQPAAAMTVHTVDEVRTALAYAEAEGLPLRVHTSGHASASARDMRGALLLRTQMDGGVELDLDRRVARIPAGTRWGAVVESAAIHGLGAPHGSSTSVGAVGFALRGGLSFYGRKVGLAANSVRAVDLVTADGELRRVDATSDPELFWGLRGGGGGFGVVTAIEIELFAATHVVTGAAFWSAAHAERLLSVWRRWTLDAPWEITTSVRVMNLPQLPNVPAALSTGPVLALDGAVLSRPDDLATANRHAEDVLGPLRAIAEPIMDTWQVTTPDAVTRVHMDPTEPVAFVGDHMLLNEIGGEGAARWLGAVGEGSGSPLVVAGLRQLGGAFSRPDPAGGVLNHLTARYSYAGSGVPVGPVTQRQLRAHCEKVREAMRPWDAGVTVPSFVESWKQPQRHLTAAQVDRLDRLRARVDPSGRFRDDITPNAAAHRAHDRTEGGD